MCIFAQKQFEKYENKDMISVPLLWDMAQNYSSLIEQPLINKQFCDFKIMKLIEFISWICLASISTL